MNETEQIRALAAEHGLEVREPTAGHVQLLGRGMLVNWYPTSKRRTAYCAGAHAGRPYCTAQDVLALALGVAPEASPKRARRNSSRMKKKRRKLHAADPRCHWCRAPLDLEESTVDHLIPLSRGGANRDDNLVLACKPCNHSRGDALPTTEAQP